MRPVGEHPDLARRPPFPSLASGVGQSSDDPDPISPVGSADVTSTHHERPAGVASLLQPAKDDVSASTAESRDVLNENPIGSHLLHDAQ
jgi:hypothetical protein